MPSEEMGCDTCGESLDECNCLHDAGQCGGSVKGTCKICERAFDQAQEAWGLDHFYGPGTAAESSGG